MKASKKNFQILDEILNGVIEEGMRSDGLLKQSENNLTEEEKIAFKEQLKFCQTYHQNLRASIVDLEEERKKAKSIKLKYEKLQQSLRDSQASLQFAMVESGLKQNGIKFSDYANNLPN